MPSEKRLTELKAILAQLGIKVDDEHLMECGIAIARFALNKKLRKAQLSNLKEGA